jgi:hypothetical protein
MIVLAEKPKSALSRFAESKYFLFAFGAAFGFMVRYFLEH